MGGSCSWVSIRWCTSVAPYGAQREAPLEDLMVAEGASIGTRSCASVAPCWINRERVGRRQTWETPECVLEAGVGCVCIGRVCNAASPSS